MTALRSLLFNVLFFTWSALIMVLCLPLLLLPRAATFFCTRVWARVTFFLLAHVCGLRHEVRGLENLPDGPCLIAAKHQSAWDTLIFPLLIEQPAYVYKRELLRVPVFGWYLARTEGIPVDRAGGARALRALVEAARRCLAQGRPIVIYPEGTRVAPGKTRAYHPGVAALYDRLGLTAVPVAVNSGLFWGRRSFRKKPGVIALEVLPAIPPGLSRRDFTAELERRIETASRRLMDSPRDAA